MKPIETHYDGHRFRSRIEARWAVVFNQLGIRWDYEKDGFSLPTGPYLPDFWLPTVRGGSWFEVKGASPSAREQELAKQLAAATKSDVILAAGPIPEIHGLFATPGLEVFFADESWDDGHMFCQCPSCWKIDVQFEGRANRIDCDCTYPGRDEDNRVEADAVAVASAYTSGRRARFEHGESGS